MLIAFILLGGEDDSGAFCCLGTSVLSSSGGCLGFFPEACAECAGAAVSAVPLSAVSGCPIRYVLCGGRAFHSADSDSSLAQADDRRRGCEDPCSDSNVRGLRLWFSFFFFSLILAGVGGLFRILLSGTFRIRIQYFSEYIRTGGLRRGHPYEGPEREQAELPFLPFLFLGALLGCWWGGVL